MKHFFLKRGPNPKDFCCLGRSRVSQGTSQQGGLVLEISKIREGVNSSDLIDNFSAVKKIFQFFFCN